MKNKILVTAALLVSNIVLADSSIDLEPAGKVRNSSAFWVSQYIGGSPSGKPKSSITRLYLDGRPFTTAEGYCYLTNIQGAWAGGAEKAAFDTNKRGEWSFNYSSGGSRNHGGGVCVVSN